MNTKIRLANIWNTKAGSYVAYVVVVLVFIVYMVLFDIIGNIFKEIKDCLQTMFHNINYDIKDSYDYFKTFTPETIRESANSIVNKYESK